MEFTHKKIKYEKELEQKNKEIIQSEIYSDEDGNLETTLDEAAKRFCEIDEHCNGLIDLKRVFEKAGMAKTHLELVKIINEVAPGKEQIIYEDFVKMILGKQNSVLKLVLKFMKMGEEAEKPKHVAEKKTFSQLP